MPVMPIIYWKLWSHSETKGKNRATDAATRQSVSLVPKEGIGNNPPLRSGKKSRQSEFAVKFLVLCRIQQRIFQLKEILFMCVPGIGVLTHHDAKYPHIPHHSGTMTPRFQFVVQLLSLVRTLGGSAAVVDELPFGGFTPCCSNQPGIVVHKSQKCATVFGRRARIGTGIHSAFGPAATPFLTTLFPIKAI